VCNKAFSSWTVFERYLYPLLVVGVVRKCTKVFLGLSSFGMLMTMMLIIIAYLYHHILVNSGDSMQFFSR
jgi:hypothetical protein